MAKFCTNCGAEIAEGKRFCTNCGEKTEETQQTQSVPIQSQQPQQPIQQPVQNPQFEPATSKYINAANTITEEAKPRRGSKYAPISTFGYIGWMILMSIPILGWIIAGIFAFGKNGSVNRRSLARAMLIFIRIFIIITVASLIIYWSVLVELSKYVKIDIGI
jgi:predicted nucleic acid-binding Zn ribbon protein